MVARILNGLTKAGKIDYSYIRFIKPTYKITTWGPNSYHNGAVDIRIGRHNYHIWLPK